MGYRPGFDGLRAIAVSLVWLAHLNVRGFGTGWFGVDIFFVLSGYLITSVLAEEHRQQARINLRKFYIRRVLRLTPALWLLLISISLWYVIARPVGLGVLGAIAASATYIMNWNRIFSWMGEWSLGHTWSLAIEEQFYFFWPMTMVVMPRKYWALVAFGAATLSAIWLLILATKGVGVNRLYNGLDCRASGLLLGAGCALLAPRLRERMVPAVPAMGFISVVGLALLLCVPPIERPISFAFFTIAASIFTSVLVLAIDCRWAERVLSFRPLIIVGRWSYGIYLWHYPLMGVFSFYHLIGAWSFLTIPLTFLIAGLSFNFVEKPILRFKEHFAGSDGPTGAKGSCTANEQPAALLSRLEKR